MSQLSHTIYLELSAILLHYNFQNSIKELTPGLVEDLESYGERFDSEDNFTTTKDIKIRLDRDNDNDEAVEISCCPRIRFEIKTKTPTPTKLPLTRDRSNVRKAFGYTPFFTLISK